MGHLLPEELEQESIEGMAVGDTGYCVAWAVQVDKFRQLWMDGSHSIHDRPGGTVHLKIQRTPNGYAMLQSSVKDYRYSLQGNEFFPTDHHFKAWFVDSF